MIRINKNTVLGNTIIDAVLNGAWNTDTNRYEGDLYYGLLTTPSRTLLIDEFLNEQNNKCCYCLAEITNDEVTIEHIIPRRATQTDFDRYMTIPELNSNIIYKSNFNRSANIIPPALYPHDLGYNNMIASCGRSNHCNHKRAKKYIDPYFYYDDLDNQFTYEPFGSCHSDTITFDALNLNTDFLKMVRKLWFLISRTHQTLIGINTTENLQEIVDVIIVNEEEKFLETFTGEASKVSELMKYRWFFEYYLTNPFSSAPASL